MKTTTLIDEIIKCGIDSDSSVIHFGSGYKNGKFLSDLSQRNLIEKYVGIESESERINTTVDSLIKIGSPEKFKNILNITMQDYIVDNNETYDFAVITGIFDKQLYGDEQFQFVHSVINEMFNFVEDSVIFTYNALENQEETYNIHYMNGYIQNNYNRFSILKINENEYLYCINKYYLSYTNTI
jgi:hypothetical protein